MDPTNENILEDEERSSSNEKAWKIFLASENIKLDGHSHEISAKKLRCNRPRTGLLKSR